MTLNSSPVPTLTVVWREFWALFQNWHKSNIKQRCFQKAQVGRDTALFSFQTRVGRPTSDWTQAPFSAGIIKGSTEQEMNGTQQPSSRDPWFLGLCVPCGRLRGNATPGPRNCPTWSPGNATERAVHPGPMSPSLAPQTPQADFSQGRGHSLKTPRGLWVWPHRASSQRPLIQSLGQWDLQTWHRKGLPTSHGVWWTPGWRAAWVLTTQKGHNRTSLLSLSAHGS